MAKAALVPSNGAVTYGSFIFDFQSFEIDQSQIVENITPYSALVCTTNVGNGTPDFDITIGAYGVAHAAGTAPALPVSAPVGASTTLTLDTGVTESLTMVQSRFRI